MEVILRFADNNRIYMTTSVVTLTEVLNKPLKSGDTQLAQIYRNFFLATYNIDFLFVNMEVAERAAQLRAKYNMKTPDALQVASAIESHCDAFLTNDLRLKRMTEINVLILDDLELDSPPQP